MGNRVGNRGGGVPSMGNNTYMTGLDEQKDRPTLVSGFNRKEYGKK